MNTTSTNSQPTRPYIATQVVAGTNYRMVLVAKDESLGKMLLLDVTVWQKLPQRGATALPMELTHADVLKPGGTP